MGSDINDEDIMDLDNLHLAEDHSDQRGKLDEKNSSEPLPTFIEVSDMCQVYLLKSLSRKDEGWNWALTSTRTSPYDIDDTYHCSNEQSVPIGQLLDFLGTHLQQAKGTGQGSVSRFAIDLYLVESLKESAIEEVFRLAKEYPNRKVFYNEVDTEFLRPHFQKVLDKSHFAEEVCGLFTRYQKKCDDKTGHILVFSGDYNQFEDLLIDESAGLSNRSFISFCLKDDW
jgi:hypothetical protein